MKKATWAQTHNVFFVPVEANFEATLPPRNKTLKNFEMYLLDNGSLQLSWESGGGLKTFVLPANMVKGVLLAPTPITPVKASKKEDA